MGVKNACRPYQIDMLGCPCLGVRSPSALKVRRRVLGSVAPSADLRTAGTGGQQAHPQRATDAVHGGEFRGTTPLVRADLCRDPERGHRGSLRESDTRRHAEAC
jgi:hypothetical protein